MAGEIDAAQEQVYDASRLRVLMRERMRDDSRFALEDARRSLLRVADFWPTDEPTDLMRLAAVSRHLGDQINTL